MRISGEKQLDLLAKLVYIAFRIQQPFTRIKEVNNPEIKPCIYAMWHAHQCCIHGIKDKANLNVLISRSVDGEIIARTVEKWGFKTVRGSKGKKGSVEATMQLIERLKNGECVAMMPDGPKGPAFVAKEGIIKIAKMAQAPIVPVYWYSDHWNFLKIPSWDSFRYPFFYTRLLNLYGEPIYVNADNTEEQDEEVRIQLQNSLNDLEKRAPEVYKEVHKIQTMEEKTKSLKILAIQLSSQIGDKKANLDKVQKLIDENISENTNIIVLPEVWTVGWDCSKFQKTAEVLEKSETVDFLSRIAKKYNSNIIGGSFITKDKDGNYYNTCPVINNKGELVATYNKMHLFSYYGCEEGKFVKNGENPILIEINGIKIGLSICYDIRFPEIYRAYRKAGADLLINMAAWPKGRAIHWDSLSRARAVENQCFMVALTQSGALNEIEWNLGESRIISYTGETISEITEGEGAICAKIDFDEIYDFREKCTVLKDIHFNYEVIKK